MTGQPAQAERGEVERLRQENSEILGLRNGNEAMGDMVYKRTKECNELAEKLTTAERQLAEARGAWQPIETAPKDGTRVLLCVVGTQSAGRDDREYYHMASWGIDHWQPFIPNDWTHWQPLPSPPQEPKE
jgi:hypothetical protein